jgi:uncharacterized membrane protein HdeD (DUF308 family)
MSESTTQEIAKEIKSGGGLMITFGILTIILGVISIGAPLMGGIAVSLIAGISLAAGGTMQILHAMKIRGDARSKRDLVVVGLMSVGFGIFMATRPVASLLAMTLVLVLFFVFAGAGRILAAFHLKPEKGWGWLLTSGIVTLVLAITIWSRAPAWGAWAIGTLFGINLLFSGGAMIFTGRVLRSAARNGGQAAE